MRGRRAAPVTSARAPLAFNSYVWRATLIKTRRVKQVARHVRDRRPSPGRLAEIIEEIANNLPPQKGNSFDGIITAVRQAVDELHEKVPWEIKLFDQPAMRKHAQKLFKAALKLEVLLETAPGMLQALLFGDLQLSPDELVSKQKMAERYLKRSESFFDELYRLHTICGQAIGKKLGSHPNFDHAKALSARSAYTLMKNHSTAKVTGTQDGPFRIVTSLLYEAVSRRRDIDLKRACDEVLEANKRKA
jgi:hypothetical protein